MPREISVPNMQSTVHAEYAMRSLTYISLTEGILLDGGLSKRFALLGNKNAQS